MKSETPQALLDSYFAAFNRADLETLVASYEPRGALVAQPGMIAEGPAALREALGAFLAMKPVLRAEKNQLVVAGDLALALTRWTLDGVGPDGKAIRMTGEATDVLRRQADGNWRVALDNPWGVALLGAQGASST
jgi:uncharacterized protein (TIGR02246 family)